MTSRAVEMAAPGKVNLILRVLDRRPDGYHNLWSVMQTIDLSDSVLAEEDDRAVGIRLSCEGADLPTDAGNLVYRAAEHVMARVGRRQGVRLVVQKRLPVAAGLGGGSSDAAATIRALATLFHTGWSREDLVAIGRELGSDVPFFFYGPTALVEGRGDRVMPLQLDGRGWLLLVNPGFSISTAWAYAKLADARIGSTGAFPFHSPFLLSSSPPTLVTWSELRASVANDFSPVMEQEFPVLRELRLLLLDRGAQTALLSGSGATVFGVFASEEAARMAADGLDRRPGWQVWVTRMQGDADRGAIVQQTQMR